MNKAANVTPITPAQRGDYSEQWAHHPIGFLIRSTKDYVVHIDKDGRLDWETTIEFDKEIANRPEAQRQSLSNVKGEICLAEATQLEDYSEEIQHHYLRLLGEALVHWIEGDASTSHTMVEGAIGYLRERSEETSRKWYLFAGINSAGLFCAVGMLAWLFRAQVIDYLGLNGFMLFLAACFGAVGAMFSIIMRSGTLKFSASAGRKLHYIEASSRISAGAVSAVIVFLAIKSQLVLGFIVNGTENPMLLFLATLTAGAGERLATSIISRFDDSAVDLPND
jgi:hypothetical protein